MAKCNIQIQFDRANRTYKLGEAITGTLEVLPGADIRCRKITLTPRWTTHGTGEQESAEGEGQVLPGAELRNNQQVSFPFAFPAPSGPLSYTGDLFQIAWYLKAVADLPLALDAEAEERFTLAHGDPAAAPDPWAAPVAFNPFAAALSEQKKLTGRKTPHPAVYSALSLVPMLIGLPILFTVGWYVFTRREEIFAGDWGGSAILGLFALFALGSFARGFRRLMLKKRRAAQTLIDTRPFEPGSRLPRLPGKYWEKPWAGDSPRGWAKVVFTLILAGIGYFLLLVSLAAILARGASALSLALIVLLVLGVALTSATLRGVMASLRLLRARWKLGRVDVNLTPPDLRCRDDLYCSVEFRPPAPVRLKRAVARLEAFEVADYKSKKKRITETRPIHEHEVALAADRSLLTQESVLLTATITVPADAPPTFLAADHKILWFVVVRIELVGGTQWSRIIPTFVRP
jgi:hypothetical protein